MESLMFLAVCGGVALVVWWAVRNDGAGPEDATTGLLRMAESTGAAAHTGTGAGAGRRIPARHLRN